MAELTIGAYRLRFLTIEKETHVLSFLTGNGLGNVVTVESGIQADKQTVRLDIISVCIIDSPHYSGLFCP